MPPGIVEKLGAAEDPVGMGRQEVKEAKLGGAERDLRATREDAAALAINHEIAGLDPLRAGVRRPPEQGSDPRPKLARRERLDHVVVRPRVESPDPVRLLRPGGDEDDGHFTLGRAALPAQPPQELVPARPRQHPVEEHEVHPGSPERLPRARHVLRLADLVSRLPEIAGHHLPHDRLVLDDQTRLATMSSPSPEPRSGGNGVRVRKRGQSGFWGFGVSFRFAGPHPENPI